MRISNDVEFKVKQIISKIVDIEIEDIDEDSSPRSIPNWRGRNHLLIIESIEKEFDIFFSSSERETFVNFKIIMATIISHMDEN